MLKLVESRDELTLFDETDNIFVIKSTANFLTYFGNACHSLWRQNDSALISIVDANTVIWSSDNADFEEISAFLRHSGLSGIFTNRFTAEKMSLNIRHSGQIMKFAPNAANYFNIINKANFSECKNQPFAKYSAVYSLLEKCGFGLPEKNAFLADLSYRRHRRTSRIFADDDYFAVSLTGYETDRSAIISAVAVDEKYRRRHLGSECLNRLCNELLHENKSIYLYREKDKNEQFYISNGFENTGEFVNCTY